MLKNSCRIRDPEHRRQLRLDIRGLRRCAQQIRYVVQHGSIAWSRNTARHAMEWGRWYGYHFGGGMATPHEMLDVVASIMRSTQAALR